MELDLIFILFKLIYFIFYCNLIKFEALIILVCYKYKNVHSFCHYIFFEFLYIHQFFLAN
jgi:hypothetical protein